MFHDAPSRFASKVVVLLFAGVVCVLVRMGVGFCGVRTFWGAWCRWRGQAGIKARPEVRREIEVMGFSPPLRMSRISTSNNNWVCFPCRTVLRQAKTYAAVPACPRCGTEIFCLGSKVEVPPQRAVRAWNRIRQESRRRLYSGIRMDKLRKTRRQHALEKEIARMSQLPLNRDRTRQIRMLVEDLRRPLSEAKLMLQTP